MSSWAPTTIETCCEILDSMRIPVNEDERSRRIGDVPYYGANGQQGWIDDYLFDEPLILLAEDGGNFEQYDRRPIAYRIYGPSWVNNHAHILRGRDGWIQDFIFYCLEHKDITPFINGGTRSKLNQSELRQITIQAPHVGEQRKIARILATLDNLIEKTEALIAKYQSIKQGMMHDLFTRGVDSSGQLRPTHEQAPDLYKQSELGWIPKEWEVMELKELYGNPIRDFGSFSMTNLITFLETGVPFIKSEMIEVGSIKWDNVFYISERVHGLLNKSHVRKGDILFSKIGSALGKAVIYDGSRGVCNSNAAIAKIRVDNQKATTPFVASYLNHNIAQTQFKNMVVSLLPRINLGDISSLLTPVPSVQEQRTIDGKLEALDSTIATERRLLAKHKKAKSGLMQDLLTGKVRVKVHEAEEACAHA